MSSKPRSVSQSASGTVNASTPRKPGPSSPIRRRTSVERTDFEATRIGAHRPGRASCGRCAASHRGPRTRTAASRRENRVVARLERLAVDGVGGGRAHSERAYPVRPRIDLVPREVAEWLKALAATSRGRKLSSRVRIPPSPLRRSRRASTRLRHARLSRLSRSLSTGMGYGAVHLARDCRTPAPGRIALSTLVGMSSATSSTGSTAAPPQTSDALAGAANGAIAWTACGEQLARPRCARSNGPRGGKIKLAVIRHLASRPEERIGSMFVNPADPAAPSSRSARRERVWTLQGRVGSTSSDGTSAAPATAPTFDASGEVRARFFGDWSTHAGTPVASHRAQDSDARAALR